MKGLLLQPQKIDRLSLRSRAARVYARRPFPRLSLSRGGLADSDDLLARRMGFMAEPQCQQNEYFSSKIAPQPEHERVRTSSGAETIAGVASSGLKVSISPGSTSAGAVAAPAEGGWAMSPSCGCIFRARTCG